MVDIYEKLGLFYLGQDVDKSSLEATEALTLLKNKNFPILSKISNPVKCITEFKNR